MSTDSIEPIQQKAGLGRRETPSSSIADAQVRSIRAMCVGRPEWRVQDPVSGAYCFHGRKHEVVDWFDQHKRQFPDSRYAHYVIAEHVIQTPLQETLEQCLDELLRARQVAARYEVLVRQMLSSQTVVFNGVPYRDRAALETAIDEHSHSTSRHLEEATA